MRVKKYSMPATRAVKAATHTAGDRRGEGALSVDAACDSGDCGSAAPGFDRAAFHKEFNADVLTFFREIWWGLNDHQRRAPTAALATIMPELTILDMAAMCE